MQAGPALLLNGTSTKGRIEKLTATLIFSIAIFATYEKYLLFLGKSFSFPVNSRTLLNLISNDICDFKWFFCFFLPIKKTDPVQSDLSTLKGAESRHVCGKQSHGCLCVCRFEESHCSCQLKDEQISTIRFQMEMGPARPWQRNVDKQKRLRESNRLYSPSFSH